LFSENGVAKKWKRVYMQEVFDGKSDCASAMANESYQVNLDAYMIMIRNTLFICNRQPLCSLQSLQGEYLINTRNFAKRKC